MRKTIQATINGQTRELMVKPNQTLLDVLRDDLRLRGTLEGCSVGVCGSCTVLLDGEPFSSCLVLASNVEGRQVTTIEGLAQKGELSRVQKAFLEYQAFQCGYCTRGMIMAVEGLLREYAAPTEDEIRDYLSGNICRCGTYTEVLAAVQSVIGAMQGSPVP